MLFGLFDTHTNVSKIPQYQLRGATVQDLTYPHRCTFGSFLAFFGEAEKHVFGYVKIGSEGWGGVYGRKSCGQAFVNF